MSKCIKPLKRSRWLSFNHAGRIEHRGAASDFNLARAVSGMQRKFRNKE